VVVPIAKWVTRTGHRFTDSGDSLSLDVLAVTNHVATGSGGEGGIASVVFTINDVAQAAITTPSIRTPNYTQTVSPITGTTTMPSIFAYGMDLLASDYSNGTITITCVVTTAAGSTTSLPTLKVYNNKTTDTRPSSKVIYVSPTGNDSNDGLTSGNPVLNIQKGFDLAHTTRNLGGAEVVLLPGVHSWSGYSFGMSTDLHTGDHWWVTLRVTDGASITRPGAITSNGDVSWSGGGSDVLYLRPNTGAGDDDTVRLLVVFEGDGPSLVRGDMFVFTNAGTDTYLHAEGGSFGHPAWSLSNKWSVRFSETKVRLFNHVANGNAGFGEIGATNVHVKGTDNAFVGLSWLHGNRITDWTGICHQSTGYNPSNMLCSCLIESQRYDHTVSGLIDCEVDSGVEIQVLDANNVRIQQSAGSDVNPLGDYGNPSESIDLPDLSVYGAELELSDLWGLTIYNGTTPQSGSTGLLVTGSGTNGTGPYIDVAWPTHGYVSTFSLARWRIRTTNRLRDDGGGNPYPFVDAVHPDVWQFFLATTDTIIADVRVEDCQSTRVWASNNGAMTRMAIVNCGDGSLGNISDLSPVNGMTDCLFHYCSFGATADWGSITATGINEVRRCVFQSIGNLPTGVTFDDNHFVNPAQETGTNSRTGSFFNADPTVSPFSLQPLDAQQGTAAGLEIPFPSEFTYLESGGDATAGVWSNVANGSWIASAGGSSSSTINTKIGFGLGFGLGF